MGCGSVGVEKKIHYLDVGWKLEVGMNFYVELSKKLYLPKFNVEKWISCWN